MSLHELGHSYIAKIHGIGIRSIMLYIFCGVSSMEEIPRDPRLELQMVVVGPVVSGLLGLACILLYFQLAPLIGFGHPFSIFLWTLGVVNLMLMAFNLLPAFPMDGVRVLRAWFATRMPYTIATRQAAGIGGVVAILMVIIWLFSFNFLLLLTAFFIYIGASKEEKAMTVDFCLEGIKVRNIMSSNLHTVTPDKNLSELLDLMFREKHRGYPVVENGVLEGIVTLTHVQKIPDAQRNSTTVGQVMRWNLHIIGPEEEASSSLKLMTERGIRRLPIIENKNLVGIVSREDLVRAMELLWAMILPKGNQFGKH